MSHDLQLLTELERVLSRKQEQTGVKKYNLSLLQLEIKITNARLSRVQHIAEQCGYVAKESKAESMPQVG